MHDSDSVTNKEGKIGSSAVQSLQLEDGKSESVRSGVDHRRSNPVQKEDELEALHERFEILKRASISAYPNPIQVDSSGVGVTTISYTFLEGYPVEIHVGSPN